MNASMTQNPISATVNCPIGGCAADSAAYSFADPVTCELSRRHEREVVVRDEAGEYVAVALSSLETRPGRQVGEDDGLPLFEAIEGAEPTFSEATVSVYTSGAGAELTATDARVLARVLTRKGEELDDLHGPSVNAGSTIRYAREGYGGTVQELAEDAGLSVERVQAIEAGGLMTHAEQHALIGASVAGITRARGEA